MEQNLNESLENHNLPLALAGVGHFNNTGTGELNYQLSIPSHVRKQGLKLFYIQASNAPTPALGIGGLTNSLGWVQRVNSTPGTNHSPGIYLYTLTSTDVTNGYVTIPSINTSMSLCGLVMWNCDGLTTSLDPASPTSTATTGFNRLTTVNSIASMSMTATQPSLHIKVLVRSGNGRTTTPPSGYNLINETQFGGGGAVGSCNISLAGKLLNTGDVAGTDNWTVSGAADTTMISFGCLLTIN